VRAIRTESADALKYWFRASACVVWKWRKAFGVGGRVKTTKGTKRAIRGAAKLGAETQKVKVWTERERRARSRRSKRLGLKPTGRWTGREWTAEQVALLGTDRDVVMARRLKRTVGAVSSQRRSRRIPAFEGHVGGGRGWTKAEVALLGTASDAAVAKKIGRTVLAVAQKRAALGIESARKTWTARDMALLGIDHDAIIAKKIGRTRGAVTAQRGLRNLPAYSGWPGGGPAWSEEEIALLGTDTDEVIAAKIGRTPGAVAQKRAAHGVAAFHDRRRGRAPCRVV
jgi:hypothetical protein